MSEEMIARLKKAPGPDRELDEALALIAGGTYFGCARFYTKSIDAALTLARHQRDLMIMLHVAFRAIETDPEDGPANIWPCIQAALIYALEARSSGTA